MRGMNHTVRATGSGVAFLVFALGFSTLIIRSKGPCSDRSPMLSCISPGVADLTPLDYLFIVAAGILAAFCVWFVTSKRGSAE